jgi:hypothetical protein
MTQEQWAALGEFLGWEVLVALIPLLLAWLILAIAKKSGYFKRATPTHVLGDGDLLPWAMPIASISIRRLATSEHPNGVLMILIIIIVGLSIVGFAGASTFRYTLTPADDGYEMFRTSIGHASWFVASMAIVVGGLVAIDF